MKVVIDKHSGFCFGVINAIKTAESFLAENQVLYCLGDIVHNNEEVKRLTDMGLVIVSREEFEKLHDTTVLIRAHGEPPETYEIATKNNIHLVDTTCQVVLNLQKNIKASCWGRLAETELSYLLFRMWIKLILRGHPDSILKPPKVLKITANLLKKSGQDITKSGMTDCLTIRILSADWWPTVLSKSACLPPVMIR